MVYPDKCIIRKICESDYENYLVMINEFRETFFTKEQFVDTLWYLNPFSEIWVVEYENHIIATGTILYEKKLIHNNGMLAHIEDICVKKEYRKFGIGKMIVQHLIKLAKEFGCYKVTLDCSEANSHFYETCGMVRNGVQMVQLSANIFP